ncbi:MAG: PilZ domain-containing protein [Acidobacteriota bacterium]
MSELREAQPDAAERLQQGDQDVALDGRRQSERVRVDGRLRTRIQTLDLDVEMRDISLGGFLVASDIDINTGGLHVFEVATTDRMTYTLRARVVHCRAPRGDEAAFLSGWRCAADEVTQQGLTKILDDLSDGKAGEDTVLIRTSQTSMGVWHLALTSLDSGATIGHALVCPVVRYASVLWQVSAQIERRHPESAFWHAIAAELDQIAEGHELPQTSLTADLLVPEMLRSSCGLRVVNRPSFASDRAVAVTAELDRYIWHLSDSPS